MEISHSSEKKPSSRKVPRKKATQGHRVTSPVYPTVAKTAEKVVVSEDSPSEAHPSPNESVQASAAKKAKKENMSSSKFYFNECVVENLEGDLNVAYFKNPGEPTRESYEPFTVSFRAVYGDRVEDELGVVSIGYRCDAAHQFIPNKKGADPQKMKYGWCLFINDTATDPGDWAIEMCKTLNENQTYLDSFDKQRTNGKTPHFRVLDDITQKPRRKLDQVMMDEGIAKYLLKKYNLKDFGVRRGFKTDEDWNKLLQPYFKDVKRGRGVIEDYLRAQTAAQFTPSN